MYIITEANGVQSFEKAAILSAFNMLMHVNQCLKCLKVFFFMFNGHYVQGILNPYSAYLNIN